MKKFAILLAFVLLLTLSVGLVSAKNDCVAIQDGILTYSAGHYLGGTPLMTGYDPYGYNYQAHMFNGSYANAYLGRDGFPPYTGDDASYLAANPTAANHWTWSYRNDQISMKWNDAWLSNKDCDDDGALDRPNPYIGSGAWETNHQWGAYDMDGELCEWDYFVKIVAVPSDATLIGSDWYTADGALIGYTIWGQFAVTQEVYNDPCSGYEGVLYKGDNSGFGTYAP